MTALKQDGTALIPASLVNVLKGKGNNIPSTCKQGDLGGGGGMRVLPPGTIIRLELKVPGF